MGTKERTIYQERTTWATWVMLVFWGGMVVGMISIVLAGSDPFSVLVLVAVAGLIHACLVGLWVRLYRDRLVVSLGLVELVRKQIPYEAIQQIESVTYRPIREFGGWGVRFRGRKRAWTARGNRAVVLHLKDGVQLYIGTDNPMRLEERIRTIGGARIGGGPST